MACNGDIDEFGNCLGTIVSGRCQSVCEIINGSDNDLNGCYDDAINFISHLTSEYHCTLFNYTWYK